MNTKSEFIFEWSVKCFGVRNFYVGIASLLQLPGKNIYDHDENAIFFNASDLTIKIGTRTIHSGLDRPSTGDVISFKFRPYLKNLEIHWVRVELNCSNNLKFKNGKYKVDLQDDINYFAFFQSVAGEASEAHLVN